MTTGSNWHPASLLQTVWPRMFHSLPVCSSVILSPSTRKVNVCPSSSRKKVVAVPTSRPEAMALVSRVEAGTVRSENGNGHASHSVVNGRPLLQSLIWISYSLTVQVNSVHPGPLAGAALAFQGHRKGKATG